MAFTVRLYRPTDTDEIVALFRETVRSVNRRDYSDAQLRAWAPDEIDPRLWAGRLAASHCVVAEQDDMVVGFANLTDQGLVDLLYVHKDYQRMGIAHDLLTGLEAEAGRRGIARLVTEASLTARPFFERRGFHVIASQVVACRGQTLENFRMEKTLRKDVAR